MSSNNDFQKTKFLDSTALTLTPSMTVVPCINKNTVSGALNQLLSFLHFTDPGDITLNNAEYNSGLSFLLYFNLQLNLG